MKRQALRDEDIQVSDGAGLSVSGLLTVPPDPLACYVFAHGAGAGMRHPFMKLVADGLAQRRIASLRYQFPYMERGSKRPDPPALAQRTVRAAAGAALAKTGLPLIAGGKSFGGRMSSQAQAMSPLEGVRGLVFLGFPLHPPGKPSTERATHLSGVTVPMLFVQGTRDKLAELVRVESVVASLPLAALLRVQDADHGFDVPARSGRQPADVMSDLLTGVAEWVERVAQVHTKRTAA